MRPGEAETRRWARVGGVFLDGFTSCRKAVAAGEVVSLSPLSGCLSHEGVGSGGGRVFRESQEHAGALAKENLRAKG